MSASTGAPAFFARALGCHDLMKGIAAAIAPAPPTTAVVAVRKRRRPRFTPSFAIRHSESTMFATAGNLRHAGDLARIDACRAPVVADRCAMPEIRGPAGPARAARRLAARFRKTMPAPKIMLV